MSARRALVIAAAVAALGGCEAGPIEAIGSTLTSGVVAHWTFDDGTGTVLTDSSGNGRNGALTGGTWIAGRFGRALHFDGAAGDSVSVPSFPDATSSWSVAAWVRPPSGDFGSDYLTLVSTEHISADKTTGGGWELNVTLTTSGAGPFYEFAYYKGPSVQDHTFYDCYCVTAGAWTHLAAVVDGDARTLAFYRDGALQKTVTDASLIVPGSPVLYMARWEMDGRLYTGDLDDVIIYDRALSAPEVAALTKVVVPHLAAH